MSDAVKAAILREILAKKRCKTVFQIPKFDLENVAIDAKKIESEIEAQLHFNLIKYHVPELLKVERTERREPEGRVSFEYSLDAIILTPHEIKQIVDEAYEAGKEA